MIQINKIYFIVRRLKFLSGEQRRNIQNRVCDQNQQVLDLQSGERRVPSETQSQQWVLLTYVTYPDDEDTVFKYYFGKTESHPHEEYSSNSLKVSEIKCI